MDLDHIAFGAARLAITGRPGQGDQPHQPAPGGDVLVFNGEIYNTRDLGRALRAAGERCADTASDTEVLWAALRAWGSSALARLDGMFALAFYDARERTVLLARDRSGQKPLFWTATQGGLAFASEPAALVAGGWSRGQIDPQSLFDFLVFLAPRQDRSFYGDVQALGPGCALTIAANGRSRLSRYWDALDVLNRPSALSSEAFDARAARLLTQSVAACAPMGRDYAVSLSAGIDSGLVASLASVRAPAPFLETLSIQASSPFDEAADAARLARRITARGHRITKLDAMVYAAALKDLSARSPNGPIATPDMVLVSHLCHNLARDGIRVLMTGDGADELGGYPSYRSFAALDATPGQDGAFGSSQRHIQLLAPDAAGALWRGPPVDNPLASLTAIAAAIDPHLLDAGHRRLAATDFRFRLPQLMAPRMDLASMAQGVELRAPFLCNGLIDLCLAAPSALKFDAGGPKRPFRRLFAQRLGAARLPRRKLGFGRVLTPFLDTLSRADLARLLARDSALGAFIDIGRLRERVDQGRVNGFEAFAFVALDRWLERSVAQPFDLAARQPAA